MTEASAFAVESERCAGRGAVASAEILGDKNRYTENFPVGSSLIRADLRPHIHTLYNFARTADDIADHPLLEPQEKLIRLSRFTAVLLSDKANEVPAPLPCANSLRATSIGPQHCIDLITAFKRDATQLRYADWDDCWIIAVIRPRLSGGMCWRCTASAKSAWPANDALCNALQIINHIQDCGDDYRALDRVYIPQDMLAAHGADTADLARPKSTESLRATLDAMLDKLDAMMPEARNLPKCVPDKRLRAETSIICALAERLIRLLRRRDPLCDKVKLGKVAIAGAVTKGLIRAWV